MKTLFLENCKRAGLIPKFLKFRIPSNGCFDEKSISDFQRQLLNKELLKAKQNLKLLSSNLDEKRAALRSSAPEYCLPSVVLHARITRRKAREEQRRKHNKKLTNLSEDQERPLFNVQNTVVQCGLDSSPPAYVLETLSLGPKNAVLDTFDQKEILAEVDHLLYHCDQNNVSDDIVTDINIKTLNYIKKCKKMKSSRNVMLTKKYLKDHSLLAIPFDKGIGICLMKKETYHEKMDVIIKLPQFEKYVKPRKNAKHPLLKEQERIKDVLDKLLEEGEIDETLHEGMMPIGSQPARLYGLAKVHKRNIPMRPVLSMPGSAYHKIAVQIANWLKCVPECKINSSSKSICDKLKTVTLAEDEIVVSFDVSSLYTNVPVIEAIEYCADLLYARPAEERPPVSRDTFVSLAKIASCGVIMSTHDGYYKQIDGLAMGSPPAPHLANGWLSQFEGVIRGNAQLYERYMDDIIMEMKKSRYEGKLGEISNLHENLTFTGEVEQMQPQSSTGSLPFLDMSVLHDHNTGQLSSTWYNKPTDTGLILNYHALAPKRYKRSVVSGFVHRIYRACSSWQYFHESLEKAKRILESNQYPPTFYHPIIQETLENIVNPKEKLQSTEPSDNSGKAGKTRLRVQYRGKCTEDYARALHKANAPCSVVMTLRKLKTVLPSLKPTVPKMLKSGVVYQITCPSCQARYVGETTRHLQTRIKEHEQRAGPMKKHLASCNTHLTTEDVDILKATARGEAFLLTLEALFIRELKPRINTKDEYRSRELKIKL